MRKYMILRKKPIDCLISLFGAFSFSFWSTQQIVIEYSSTFNVLATFVVAFIVALYWTNSKSDSPFWGGVNKIEKSMLFLVSIIITIVAYENKSTLARDWALKMGDRDNALSFLLSLFYSKCAYFISFFGCLLICVMIYKVGKSLLIDLLEHLPLSEIKLYAVISVVYLILITIVYIIQPQWYQQYDMVYSMDSIWTYTNIYQNLNYYDIRHPIMSEIAFPIWALASSVIKVVCFNQHVLTLTAIILQWINFLLLLGVGIILRKITQNRMVVYLYMCSFPTLLYSLAFEKFALCIIFVVLYVYSFCLKKNYTLGYLICAIGMLPINIYIAILELFRGDSIQEKVSKIKNLILAGIITCICLGRVFLLNINDTILQLFDIRSGFGESDLSIIQRFIAVANMLGGTIFSLPSIIQGEDYLWKSVSSSISICSIFAILLIFWGFYQGHKKLFYQICFAWIVMSIILFVPMNWAPYESPLFSILFSWASVPLVALGIEDICARIKIKKDYGLIFFAIMVLVINLFKIVDIMIFMEGA